MASLEENLALIDGFRADLGVATSEAQDATLKHKTWVEGGVTVTIPTDDGPIKSLSGQIEDIKANAQTQVDGAVAGYDTQVNNAIAGYDVQVDNYLLTLGFEPSVLYAGGINISRRSQTVSFEGDRYYWAGTLPFTTSGTFANDTDFRLIQSGGDLNAPTFSFAEGGTLQNSNETVAGVDGQWYYWEGDFPKVIAAGSTVYTAGGLGESKFNLVGGFIDPRSELERHIAGTGHTLNSQNFELGATLVSTKELLFQSSTGKLWKWVGAVPKVVNAGDTPDSSGGVSSTAWVDFTPLIKMYQDSTAFASLGYNVVGDFVEGFQLTGGSQYLINSDSQVYIWRGTFPRTVTAGTDPTTLSDFISVNLSTTGGGSSPSILRTTAEGFPDPDTTALGTSLLFTDTYKEYALLLSSDNVRMWLEQGNVGDELPSNYHSIAEVVANPPPLGSSVVVDDYYGLPELNNSGVLFFKVVAAGTGVADGGKYIDIDSTRQLEQNLKRPYDPRSWGAYGNSDINKITEDTIGIHGAVAYGSTHIGDGYYYMDSTLVVDSKQTITSAAGATIDYRGATGAAVVFGSRGAVSDMHVNNLNIVDNGQDRQNSNTVFIDDVNQSHFEGIKVRVGSEYESIYGSLTDSEKLDLKFGVRLQDNSYSNFITKFYLSRSTLDLRSADNHIVGNVIWGNERRVAINVLTNSATLEGNQIIPGEEYGVYSNAADITLIQIIDNYFDGNVRLQTEIATGHCIYFDGNLRRSIINNNRFFIPAKRSIHIGGTLESSSIAVNTFSNGDSADLGFGDIYLGKSNGSNIVLNTFYRDNLAAKTGAGRTQPDQPPITVDDIGSEFDEPTFIANNSLQGVNFYANSVYPSVSGILTKGNHKRINNNNTFESRYSDNQELLCSQVTLADLAALQALPSGDYYSSSLAAIGVTPSTDPSGWIKITRLQSSTDLSVLDFAKIELLTDNNQLLFYSTLKSGTWSTFRQV